LAGIPQERIFVVYLGIDEKFFSLIPQLAVKKPLSMLYAGGIEARKGIFTLISSMSNLRGTYHLNVAGGISPEAKKNPVLMDFFSNSKVNYLGGLSRSGLAQLMADSSIFVFPSYCEGSARVIFEAMSAGCFVITTPNSGSIVKHGEHGFLVPPGDVIALTAAIEDALANPEMIAKIGKRNSELVRTQYRQKDYALKVANVYDTILDNFQNQGVST
jgi:glycosyltransferase involved in cell wall biosynthesis